MSSRRHSIEDQLCVLSFCKMYSPYNQSVKNKTSRFKLQVVSYMSTITNQKKKTRYNDFIQPPQLTKNEKEN